METFNDDRTYLYLFHMNGYKVLPCSKYCVGSGNGSVKPLPQQEGCDYKYLVGQRYDDAVKQVIFSLSDGKTID